MPQLSWIQNRKPGHPCAQGSRLCKAKTGGKREKDGILKNFKERNLIGQELQSSLVHT